MLIHISHAVLGYRRLTLHAAEQVDQANHHSKFGSMMMCNRLLILLLSCGVCDVVVCGSHILIVGLILVKSVRLLRNSGSSGWLLKWWWR